MADLPPFQKPLFFCQPENALALRAFPSQEPLYFPLFDIAPLSLPDEKAHLKKTLDRLADFALAIFVSPNAAHCALSAFFAQKRPWPKTTQAMSVGQSTAQ